MCMLVSVSVCVGLAFLMLVYCVCFLALFRKMRNWLALESMLRFSAARRTREINQMKIKLKLRVLILVCIGV